MQPYSFKVHGHKNVLATHNTTIEFTKDTELTKNGDCIIGVAANFEAKKLKKFLACRKIRITISCPAGSDMITAEPNESFCDEHEMVVRLGTHASARTFATCSDKAAKQIKREIVKHLQTAENHATITCQDER